MEDQLLDSDMMNNNEGKSLSSILENGYETNSVEYIKKGFEIFKQNAGAFIGFLVLAFIARMVAGVIPIVGSIIGIFLIPLSVGGIIVAKKIDKNENYEFGNFFDGYQKLGPLIGNAFIQGLIAVAIMLVFFIPFFFLYGFSFFSSLAYESVSDGRFAVFMIVMFVMVILFFFIFVSWTLSNQIIIFNDKGPWEAMEISRKVVSKKYFNWLGFLFLMGLLNVAGALCFLVGLLITLPTTMCALYVAYEDVVGVNLKD